MLHKIITISISRTVFLEQLDAYCNVCIVPPPPLMSACANNDACHSILLQSLIEFQAHLVGLLVNYILYVKLVLTKKKK